MSKKTEDIHELAEKIRASSKGQPVEQTLQTSERVLKRITDGIYRQPSSAIRELISNAYDADAKKVIIETDCPRFNRITIRDDGIGFSEEALASLICSIGGSPKRTHAGSEMGVTSAEDSDLSPGGRRLIGKVGIGLFAVSQITKEFQIITKTKNSSHRTIAHVRLDTHSEDELKNKGDGDFETGISRIWRQKAVDKKAHGTEIILLNLLPKTKSDLASHDRWIQSHSDNYLFEEGDEPIAPPQYHIGCVVKSDENKIQHRPHLPWKKNASPKEKFKQLIEAVQGEAGVTVRTPKLVDMLDNYLKLIWTLGLQIPVSYLDIHPFEVAGKDNVLTYKLGNTQKSKAEAIKLKPSESIGDKLGLKSFLLQKEANKFEVFIDGIQIFRPLQFKKTFLTENAIKNSLLFAGHDKPNLKNIPEHIRGGNLEFEAYLFWQPKVVPAEHSGVLVRINNSNGTLFDETFMKYPISEQTRKKQITAEIFVREGMDAALNIDRESFNYAHPHYQYLAKWLHNSFKQFATAHKRLGRELREKRLLINAADESNKLEKFVSKKIKAVKPDYESSSAKVEISREPLVNITTERKKGKMVYDAKKVLPASSQTRMTSKSIVGDLLFEEKVKSIAEVLTAYGVFDDMPYEKQENLLKTISEIIAFES